MLVLGSGIRKRAELKKSQATWHTPQKSHYNIQGPRELSQVSTMVFDEQFSGEQTCMTVTKLCMKLLRKISLMGNWRHSNWKYLVQSSLSSPTYSEEEPWPVALYHAQAQGACVCIFQGYVTGKKVDGCTGKCQSPPVSFTGQDVSSCISHHYCNTACHIKNRTPKGSRIWICCQQNKMQVLEPAASLCSQMYGNWPTHTTDIWRNNHYAWNVRASPPSSQKFHFLN